MPDKTALIWGITGQDGAYLSQLLLTKGYEVHGVKRRSSSVATPRLDRFFERVTLHYGDVLDAGNVLRLLSDVKPDEVYNLAAQSHVGVSFRVPGYSFQVASLGALNILEGIRTVCPNARYYQASSSEMYGNSPPPQSEQTPFQPVSPYAIGKLAAYWTTRMYRDAYGIFAANGILFNHESPLRGENFVTRKITQGLARILLAKQNTLRLGNLDAKRDWGNAKDYVRAMWMMLQEPEPDDFVVATGVQHTVHELLVEAAWYFGFTDDLACSLRDSTSWLIHDPNQIRPSEVDSLCGDATKARTILGWQPEYSFSQTIREMCAEDYEREVECVS